MSAHDRAVERDLADLYDNVRPPAKDHGPLYPRAKEFLGAVGTGYALGRVIRMLFK